MIHTLSKMERKVIETIAEGFSQKQVADKLHRSPNTITTHMARIKRKLKARSPLHALVIFVRHQEAERLATRYV